jgi:hypothetical protein
MHAARAGLPRALIRRPEVAGASLARLMDEARRVCSQ